MIYLDNSATTRPAPEVLERMQSVQEEAWGNAGSVHRFGQRARVILERAREEIAGILSIQPKEIVFTSSGTAATNIALKGLAWRLRRETGSWPRIISAPTEHHATLHTVEYLSALGAESILLPVDRYGRVNPSDLTAELKKGARAVSSIVSIMTGNNETGALQPVEEIAAICQEAGALLHVDAVQSFPAIGFPLGATGPDFLSASAHKLHGPKGSGLLYVKKGREFDPLLHGGAQERDRNAGTEPVVLHAGFAEAVKLADADGNARRHLINLRERLLNGLAEIENAIVTTPPDAALPQIVGVAFEDAEGLDGEGIIVGMDLEGVAVSNGSACTSGSMQPSHVLLAQGYTPAQASAAVRFSTSRYSTAEEIDFAIDALRRVLGRMRS